MLLDLKLPDDLLRAQTYFNKLVEDQAKIDIKRIAKRRTSKQNRYVHVLFQLWSTFHGYTLEEGKQVVKIELGYTYIKKNQTFLVQTSKMGTDKLSELVDKFRNWSSANGCYLPTSEEYNLRHFDYSQEIERAEIIEKRYDY